MRYGTITILLMIASLLFAQSGNDEWRVSEVATGSSLSDLSWGPSQSYYSIVVGNGGYGAYSNQLMDEWQPLDFGTTENLNAVACQQSGSGYSQNAVAVGDNGTVCRSYNGGQSWYVSRSGGEDMHSITWARDESSGSGWAVGNGGTILKSSDGGNIWTQQSTGLSNDLYGVHFNNNSDGWAVGSGGVIFKTNNGGESWSTQQSIESNPRLNDVYSTDNNNAWVCGSNGVIAHTGDGGQIWTQQSTGTTSFLYNIWFTNASNGWCVGENSTVLNTNNGGVTWAPINTGGAGNFTSVNIDRDGYAFITSSNGTIITNKPEPTDDFLLSQSQLNFADTKDSNQPQHTRVFVNTSGDPATPWTVSVPVPWMHVVPQQGTGKGYFDVYTDPTMVQTATGDSPHVEQGQVSITSNDGSISKNVNVNYTLHSQGQTNPPFGSFDTPVDNSNVQSSIPVTGWVLDDIQVDNVKIYRTENSNQIYLGDAAFVEGARPDIQQAYPDYPNNHQAGWGYMLLTNFLPNGGNGTVTLTAIATDKEGQQTTLGSKTINCDNANAVKPFGAIDTPEVGGLAYGDHFRNWGWVLTPQPNMLHECGSDISVYVDGVQLGAPIYNLYRKDIASRLPGYANSNGAGACFYFDTNEFDNGVHTIQWTARDNAGNTDGIGSRFFTIQNTSGPAPATSTNSINAGAASNSSSLMKSAVFNGNDETHAGGPYNHYFYITDRSGGTLEWQVSSQEDWITLDPPSGSGPGWVQVILDPGGLPVGNHKGEIKIAETSQANAPEYVTVNLTVHESTEPPFGEFNYPEQNSSVNGNIQLMGWALDDIGISAVKIFKQTNEDQEYLGNAAFEEKLRTDVAAFYANYPHTERAGWSYSLHTLEYEAGEHTFVAKAVDYEGNETVLAERTFVIDNSNAVNPFGDLTTPTEGMTISGDNVEITGWVLAVPPNSISQDGKDIRLFLGDNFLGSPTYQLNSPNIAETYPEHLNSDKAALSFYLDTTVFPDGSYTLTVQATDDSGHTSNNIGARTVKIINTVITRLEDEEAVPVKTDLMNAYPNPFNPSTQIEYHLAENTKVSVIIYDVLGRQVKTLVEQQYQQAGKYHIRFNTVGLASGIYFCRFTTGKEAFVKKLMLMK